MLSSHKCGTLAVVQCITVNPIKLSNEHCSTALAVGQLCTQIWHVTQLSTQITKHLNKRFNLFAYSASVRQPGENASHIFWKATVLYGTERNLISVKNIKYTQAKRSMFKNNTGTALKFLFPEKVLPDIIDMDQTGFIHNRSSVDNVQLFLDIIYSSKSDQNSCCSVTWCRKTVWPCGTSVPVWDRGKKIIGPKFTNLVKLLYKHPTAWIQTNKDISASFVLSRRLDKAVASRPYYLLSQLNCWLQLWGLTQPFVVYKLVITSVLCLYILAYFSNPGESIPALNDTYTHT